MHDEGNLYLIKHVQLFTGLSDRTIRNYISSGHLRGEKINGIWHFSPEQVEQFIYDPAVRPSILARHNSVVYDHLLNCDSRETACVILDIPNADHRKIAEFFSYSIQWNSQKNIEFSFDSMRKIARVILRGDTDQVFMVLDAYRRTFK